jgi:hypothetical protein
MDVKGAFMGLWARRSDKTEMSHSGEGMRVFGHAVASGAGVWIWWVGGRQVSLCTTRCGCEPVRAGQTRRPGRWFRRVLGVVGRSRVRCSGGACPVCQGEVRHLRYPII